MKLQADICHKIELDGENRGSNPRRGFKTTSSAFKEIV
jgi:hypothetical protein